MVRAMTVQTALSTSPDALPDAHSVLLWETSAYVEEMQTDRPHHAQRRKALCRFLRERLLPYLAGEERRLLVSGLRDEHLTSLLLADHARLRAHVENIRGSRTPDLADMAAEALVCRLDKHVRREQRWVVDTTSR